MKHFIFFFLLAGISHSLSAQVLNVEKVRAEADTTGWTGELGFDLSLSKFKDQVLKMGGEANAAHFFTNYSLLFLSNIDLINVDGASLISNGSLHTRSTFLRKKKLSPELFVQYQYNNNLGLMNRALAGGGLKYTFLSNPNLYGHFSTGFMFEYEEWKLADNTIAETRLLKNTSNIVLRGRLNPQTSLLIIGYYQARPDLFFHPRITSENQLNISINERLTFSVDFTLSYDTAPFTDVPRLTYELKNGLVFSL